MNNRFKPTTTSVTITESIEQAMKRLNENSKQHNFFKEEGLEIAKKICQPYNSHCKEVSEAVCKAAWKRNIECKPVHVMVIYKDDTNNNHYAIQYKNHLVDYTICQFLGDNKKVNCYTLWESKPKVYTFNVRNMREEAIVLPTFMSDIYDDKWKDIRESHLIEMTE